MLCVLCAKLCVLCGKIGAKTAKYNAECAEVFWKPFLMVISIASKRHALRSLRKTLWTLR